MVKEKTMIEVYVDDRHEFNLIKVQAKAKNIPDLLHKAVLLLKKEMEKRK